MKSGAFMGGGGGVWGRGGSAGGGGRGRGADIERIHIQFCRSLLGVKKSTNSCIVLLIRLKTFDNL